MSNSKNTADRIRPYLQAMEQSITAARQRRMNEQRPADSSAATPASRPDAAPATPARLRARPKRPSSFLTQYENPALRPQAG